MMDFAAACPDPIDFRAYCLTNIYDDENAFFTYSEGVEFCTNMISLACKMMNSVLKMVNFGRLPCGE